MLMLTFYRPREKFGLGLTSCTAHLKSMQVIKCHLIKHRREGGSGILQEQYAIRLGQEQAFTRRWKPSPVLEAAEAKVNFDQKFAGQSNREGLGFSPKYKRNLTVAEKRGRAVETASLDHKKEAEIHTMSLTRQGDVTKWGEDVTPYDLSWSKLITTRFPKLVSHVLNSYINSLPTPTLLRLWQKIKVATCPLCQAPKCTLMHILSMCNVALKQKRFSWRHDSVLVTLEPTLQKHIAAHNESKKVAASRKLIAFIKPGERKKISKNSSPSHLLSGAHDWKCQVDYRDDPKIFPPAICPSQLRPDIVIWSTALQSAILIELTCPSEENISQAKARKKLRYVELLNK